MKCEHPCFLCRDEPGGCNGRHINCCTCGAQPFECDHTPELNKQAESYYAYLNRTGNPR